MTNVRVTFQRTGGEIIGPLILEKPGDIVEIDETLSVTMLHHDLNTATIKCIIPAMGWNTKNGGGRGRELGTTDTPGVIAGVLYMTHTLLA